MLSRDTKFLRKFGGCLLFMKTSRHAIDANFEIHANCDLRGLVENVRILCRFFDIQGKSIWPLIYIHFHLRFL